MTPILAVALVAIVVIAVAYVVAVYRFGFQREFFLVPPVDNIDGLTDGEYAIVAEERLRELTIGCDEHGTRTGSSTNIEAQLWPERVARQQRIIDAMQRHG